MPSYGTLKEELVLQPVSGKALPVLRGEVLRIIQEEGEQSLTSMRSIFTTTKSTWA
jgi:hypothetical protein